METEEFVLVRDLLRSFAARFRVGSADDVKPAGAAAAREALGELGLTELRRSTPPAATVQECGLLAEEHGSLPLPTSFLGTVLLAPELLRLLGAPVAPGRTPTIALARDLRFPGAGSSPLVAWDSEGADEALCVFPDGTVTAAVLGPAAPSVDLLRAIRTAESPGRVVGRLDPAGQQHWQAYALIVVASELAGAARSFVEQSVEYARERSQYGRPIGSFQAVRHLLADATVLVEACASATRYAAWCLDHEPPQRALTAARVAKAEVNRSALEAVYAGTQVFGGIAQTWEHIAHLYLRKVRVGATVLATTADLLTELADPEAVR
ncbi:acyl-CoA dehydrogenase family protein [Streptomyces turgidiscabies]|uniref:Acyl-CoA dehydrogenase, C-terminal domain protein n=1 Tax=Streptomyces turgidiscabies (strain Car8) TaxID=698760 RepID=L7FFA9_STRT8|nr:MULTISPECIES: acyl-CoA dehydrogenase family protein [Streptomyces]ELP69894.1 acyl-CoA dehydrogenase, C-terminal domain protein [Streptomyces turgidiscabies Car8]MDX3499089.1 acyl-CoA dehydrogenase family protein [Streptomyces turgidiscabies]GAQ73538.1 acyl-CoA dehydrogenase [Streptomyces turgidiscabies]